MVRSESFLRELIIYYCMTDDISPIINCGYSSCALLSVCMSPAIIEIALIAAYTRANLLPLIRHFDSFNPLVPVLHAISSLYQITRALRSDPVCSAATNQNEVGHAVLSDWSQTRRTGSHLTPSYKSNDLL